MEMQVEVLLMGPSAGRRDGWARDVDRQATKDLARQPGPASAEAPSQDVGVWQDGGSAVTCEQQQGDYVNRVIVPDQQTDVAATVQAVLAGTGPKGLS